MSQPVSGGALTAAATPGIGVTIATIQGWGVQEWAAAATFVYMILLTVFLLWDRWKKRKHDKWVQSVSDDAKARAGRG